jgi:predicted  nucleic acid-binding Zn-ribbon protein
MTDYGFVCHECGRTFRGINARIGEEMCPQCGSIDIARTAPATPTAPARPAAPERGEEPFGSDQSPPPSDDV